MTTHILHDDVMDAGLHPGCPRCEELAADPRGAALDAPNRERVLAGRIYTSLDRVAARNLRATTE